MAEAGYDFEVVVPDESAECGICSRETPEKFVARLARQKAANVAAKIARGLVLGCDTVAQCRGKSSANRLTRSMPATCCRCSADAIIAY